MGSMGAGPSTDSTNSVCSPSVPTKTHTATIGASVASTRGQQAPKCEPPNRIPRWKQKPLPPVVVFNHLLWSDKYEPTLLWTT